MPGTLGVMRSGGAVAVVLARARPRGPRPAVRDRSAQARRLRRIGLPLLHVLVAGVIAAGVALLVGHDRPVGAPLFAMTMLEMVNARRRRSWAIFVFGI